jgi:serine protease Do
LRAVPQAFSKAVPQNTADLQAMEKHVRNLVAKVSPAVVSVEVGASTGSGVVISSGGLILTAGHVASRPGRSARITFSDGKVVRGKTLGADDESDCGVVMITEPGSWPHADVGDSTLPRLGSWVLALGHPGGFDSERPQVLRLGRIVRVSSTALQTDCPITTGDSGGALFDMHGRAVGIHSYVSNSMTENYHIPLTRFLDDWASLTQGQVERTRASRNQSQLHAAK